MSDRAHGDRNPHWQRWEMGQLERRQSRRQGDVDAGRQNVAASEEQQRRQEDELRRQGAERGFEEGRASGYEAGHGEGYAAGYQAGLDQALADHQARLDAELATTLEPMSRLVHHFERAISQLDDDVAYALVELALETGRQLAGRQLELAPEHILDDIEALIAAEPTLSGSPTLCVHPDDLVLVQRELGGMLNDIGWQLRADQSLTPGDCRVETEQREIDASRNDRWERLRHAVGHGKH
ncbi:flagellar assembly protein FliH [Kushneria sinocarnis]|uniref:Flagellar assembly protein FliH n=1 Tax=Kushneria sinocarnis TaxID=595502 RepID=A0A420WY68_9GAMM|nr:flagellar assembly protein FliH [Kushneria sinocarnis]RKR06101.1 flagellar assembly protein FliH [Kushneria sinocarnis]